MFVVCLDRGAWPAACALRLCMCICAHTQTSATVYWCSRTDRVPNRMENGLSATSTSTIHTARMQKTSHNRTEHAVHDIWGSSVPKMRTQFSISRIGFGLTFRWIWCVSYGSYTQSNNRIFSSAILLLLFFSLDVDVF